MGEILKKTTILILLTTLIVAVLIVFNCSGIIGSLQNTKPGLTDSMETLESNIDSVQKSGPETILPWQNDMEFVKAQ